MKFKPDTLVRVHEQMAFVKAQSTGGFFTNYFRQEMVGPQIFTAATARSVLLANDEHDFFRLAPALAHFVVEVAPTPDALVARPAEPAVHEILDA